MALSTKALFWPRLETVFVADIHLGKAAAIPVPHGTTAATLTRLDCLLNQTRAKHLVVLGDLWHDRLGRSTQLDSTLGDWTKTHDRVEFTLVKGNHDTKSGRTLPNTGFCEVDELELGSITCLHHPTPREGRYVLCGHIHPGFHLSRGRAGLTVPCFWFGQEVGVLPAFGEFTGLTCVERGPGDKMVLVAGEELVCL